MSLKRKIILIILDGFGIGPDFFGNAILKAKTPVFNFLLSNYPCGALKAAGISVGLPYNEPGNSEVGHITISAGRIVYQIIQRISFAIKDGSFFKNKTLLEAIEHVKKNKSRLHLLGLVSSGSVHSYFEHLTALIDFAKKENLDDLVIHFISDGKDAKPYEGKEILKNLLSYCSYSGIGRVGTMIGRAYGMERTGRWDMTERAYNLFIRGDGNKIKDPLLYMEESYQKKITDQILEPAIVESDKEAIIKENDSVIFFNFREDSARQLAEAFTAPDFKNFKRKKINNLYFATFVEYEKKIPAKVVFKSLSVKNSLAEIISLSGLRQLRIAESIKYAHVSYFFNCGREENFLKEDRVIIPSNIEAFNEINPRLKAMEITDKLVEIMGQDDYNFVVVNFANPDVLGHTGNFEAIVKGVEFLDNQLKRVVETATAKDWTLLITADHGNAEEKFDPLSGEVKTEHTLNNVPICLVSNEFKFNSLAGQFTRADLSAPDNMSARARVEKNKIWNLKTIGFLSDIAPTILELLDIKKPVEMNGSSFLKILLPHSVDEIK